MKSAEATLTQAAKPHVDRGRIVGLFVLSFIVVFVAAWMQVKGRSAVHAHVAPALNPTIEPSRFDANAWRLPADELLGFVAIPAGTFVMGSDPALDRSAYENERWSGERKQGQVTLPQFYIARFEVTVAQFAAFVADTGRASDAQALRGAGDHPVTHVTWTDAIAYARWLEMQLRESSSTPDAIRALLKDGWHFTLPSEAQWEKAARGADARIFPWGNAADTSKANFGRAGKSPVGAFTCTECAFGLADMSGNVWELTRSPFQPYPWTSDEPRDPKADALFVMRGGAFNDAANNVRAAIRGGIDPGARRAFIGFRLAMEQPQ